MRGHHGGLGSREWRPTPRTRTNTTPRLARRSAPLAGQPAPSPPLSLFKSKYQSPAFTTSRSLPATLSCQNQLAHSLHHPSATTHDASHCLERDLRNCDGRTQRSWKRRHAITRTVSAAPRAARALAGTSLLPRADWEGAQLTTALRTCLFLRRRSPLPRLSRHLWAV